jgi:Protein of unknown function (DUF3455)
MPKVMTVLYLAFSFSVAAQDGPNAAPDKLRPPADEKLLFQAHGVGDQVYVCKASDGNYGWTLKAPDARLLGADRAQMGRHFAGPTWEAQDGSRVRGKMTASAPSPDGDSIPWLLVQATGHEGSGVMSQVLTIQRLNTKNGKAPSGGCDAAHAGSEVRAPYEADYYFYGKQ